jgi:hypothetical protein
MVLLGHEAQVEGCFGPFGGSANFFLKLEVVLILMQDCCSVYTERTIGLEIILDAPDRTPR